MQEFIQDQQLFRNQKNYIRNDRAQDYHDILSQIFNDLKNIRDKGGNHITLYFEDNMKHDVIVIHVIQFIIGD